MKRTKKKRKPMKVNLIPVYISEEEFAEKKAEVQDIITKILIENYKRDLAKEVPMVRSHLPSRQDNE